MAPDPFEIAGYEIQPSASLVRGPQGEHRLEPKVMSVLEVLADRAGEVVGKADLMDKVWPETCVSDDALVRCVSRLRRVLGDTGQTRRVIETVPKKGYRLVAPIEGRTIEAQTTELTLEAILATCSDRIYVYDRKGRYLFASEAGAQAVGLKPREMVGRTWRELGMPAVIMEPFDEKIAEVFRGRGFIRDTVQYPAIFGPREYEYILDPIMAAEEVVAVIALVRDVTDAWQLDRLHD